MKYEGWAVTINNQVPRQQTRVTYTDRDSSVVKYPGTASSLIFPSIFATYNKGKWAFWTGFHVVAGAGGASFTALPSTENGVKAVVNLINSVNLFGRINNQVENNTGEVDKYFTPSEYDYDFISEGYAFTPGVFVGGTYEINDAIAFGLGGRWVMNRLIATSTLDNIQVAPDGSEDFVNYVNYLDGIATNEPGINDQLRNEINNIWIPAIEGAQVDIDVTQTAHGFTPIFSLNLKFSEKLNLALRYEHRTKMTYTIKVNDGKDGSGLYSEDNDSTRADLPGFLSMGVAYKLTDYLKFHAGSRLLFDKAVNWNGREQYINKNYYEISTGVEGIIGAKRKGVISGGYTWNKPNVAEAYQNEVDFRLSGHTFAIGGGVDFSEFVRLNAGLMYTYFIEGEKTVWTGINEDVFSSNSQYYKNAVVFAIGVDVAMGKGRTNGNGTEELHPEGL